MYWNKNMIDDVSWEDLNIKKKHARGHRGFQVLQGALMGLRGGGVIKLLI